MTTYDPQSIVHSPEYQAELAAQRTFMARVYGWMTIGLLTTAFVAMGIDLVGGQIALMKPQVFLPLFIVQFLAAVGLSFFIHKIPAFVAAGLFVVYAIITGIVFSILFLAYTRGSIASTFFITGGMFGTMSVIGYTTKKDLSGMGPMLLMALIGLIIASIVNWFMQSPALYWLTSGAGVIIFTVLTAYDTQKIKQSYANGEVGSATFNRTAIYGAFDLYLDFVILFKYLLRFLGTRRD